MDLFEQLAGDHRGIRAAAERLKAGGAGWEAALEALLGAFEMHDLFEREVFYPAVEETPAGADLVDVALDLHDDLASLLEDIADAPDDRAVLIDEFLRVFDSHVRDAEGPLFAAARSGLPAEMRDEMATRYQEAKDELLR